MAPPQVNLNEKPKLDGFSTLQDPLPEKKDSSETPAIVTMDLPRTRPSRLYMNAEQRRQRKRCRIACCASMTFILLLLLGLGSTLLIVRMKHHRMSWKSWCGTKGGDQVPEHVKVDHDKQLIYVQPDHRHPQAMEVLHEYNRKLIAFHNTTSNTCYIDRLDETFADGYARWQGYEDSTHVQDRTLKVVPQPIQIEVVTHFAGVHIVEHCGGERVEYYWVMEVQQTEITPENKYITV